MHVPECVSASQSQGKLQTNVDTEAKRMVAEAQLSGFKSASISMAVYVTGATKGTERNSASL